MISLFKKIILFLLLCSAFAGAIILDFFMYTFLSACPSCNSFSQFIFQNGSGISAPIIASLLSLFSLTDKHE